MSVGHSDSSRSLAVFHFRIAYDCFCSCENAFSTVLLALYKNVIIGTPLNLCQNDFAGADAIKYEMSIENSKTSSTV